MSAVSRLPDAIAHTSSGPGGPPKRPSTARYVLIVVLVVPVVVPATANLSADLATWRAGRVTVRVHGPCADRAHGLRDLASPDPLPRRANDVGRRDDAGDRAAARGTGRLAAAAAEECDDAASNVTLRKVDVRYGRRWGRTCCR